ncbi:MAG TPA: aquaporin [Aldersonia sp.]
MTSLPLGRRPLAEFVGTALRVTVVVGSGIAAAALSPGNVGLQLLENSTATALRLAVLILLFGPVSGTHFNPLVSAADWLLGCRAAPACPPPRWPPTPSRRSPVGSPAPSRPTSCST